MEIFPFLFIFIISSNKIHIHFFPTNIFLHDEIKEFVDKIDIHSSLKDLFLTDSEKLFIKNDFYL